MSTGETPTQTVAPLIIQVVGAARGNPGLSGAGIVILDDKGAPRERVAKYLGSATPLEAQMQALHLALRFARPYAPTELKLILGNETVARQLTGEHPALHPSVLRLLAELVPLLDCFARVSYQLGQPDELVEATRLADTGIDTRLRPIPSLDRPIPE